MLANLLGGFIVILVGVNLIQPIADTIYLETYSNGSISPNISGAASSILGLTTIFFALGIMSAGVAITVSGLKNAGMV